MRTLLFAYLNGNGMAIQFNVFDAEMLRDAQKHPEKYQNLQVLDPKSGKPTRIGRKQNAAGKLVRFAKKSGEEIK